MGGRSRGKRSPIGESDLADPVWLRAKGEQSDWYAAFREFMTGVGRTVADVARLVDRPLTTVEGWSVRWRWQERRDAYRDHVDDSALEAVREADIELTKRIMLAHGRLAERALGALERALDSIDTDAPVTLPQWAAAFDTIISATKHLVGDPQLGPVSVNVNVGEATEVTWANREELRRRRQEEIASAIPAEFEAIRRGSDE